MTQRIFDIENEKDMQDLWDILPDKIVRIFLEQIQCFDRPRTMVEYLDTQKDFFTSLITIDWHDKTEITRPIKEATEQDIGKLCMFSYPQEDVSKVIGILRNIKKTNDGKNCYKMYGSGLWYIKCRRLTKQEIEELC